MGLGVRGFEILDGRVSATFGLRVSSSEGQVLTPAYNAILDRETGFRTENSPPDLRTE